MTRKKKHYPLPPGIDFVLRVARRRAIGEDLARALGNEKLADSVLGLVLIMLADHWTRLEDDASDSVLYRIRQIFGRGGMRTEAILRDLSKLEDISRKFGELRAARFGGTFEEYRAYANVFEDEYELNPAAGFNLGVLLQDGVPRECVYAAPHRVNTALKADDPLFRVPAAAEVSSRWLVGGLNRAGDDEIRSLPVLVEAEAAGFAAIRRMHFSDPKSHLSRWLHAHFDECLLPRSYLPEFDRFVTRVPGKPENPEEGRARYFLVDFEGYTNLIEFLREDENKRLLKDPDEFDAYVRENSTGALVCTKTVSTRETAELWEDFTGFSEAFSELWDSLCMHVPEDWFDRLTDESLAARRPAVALIFQVALSILFEVTHLLREFERFVQLSNPGCELAEDLDEYLKGTPEAGLSFLSEIAYCDWDAGPGDGKRYFKGPNSMLTQLFANVSKLEDELAKGRTVEQIASEHVEPTETPQND
ncbi:hypothetical protein [Sutterella sp.]|uniref:hypothetical protein n=1 Tax=Sutterella sp. TaxID=1981025 RepID=UPI0026E09E46|nr:hypothetical protein [Sutterella sp.]MDO5532098.1 hypothetical protein [Sutterella sp.]